MNRHPRAKRLKLVVDLAEKAEQQALAEWGRLQQQQQQEEDKKQQLDTYVAEYQRAIALPSERKLNGGNIQNALGFIGQIRQALSQQQQQLVLLQQQVEHAQQRYLQQHGKLKALHNLLEKLDAEFDQQQEKNAQKQADEWANRMAFRSGSS